MSYYKDVIPADFLELGYFYDAFEYEINHINGSRSEE